MLLFCVYLTPQSWHGLGEDKWIPGAHWPTSLVGLVDSNFSKTLAQKIKVKRN